MTDDRDLLKLLKLSPDDPEVHQQLAQFYAAKGRTDEARTHYHKAAADSPLRTRSMGPSSFWTTCARSASPWAFPTTSRPPRR